MLRVADDNKRLTFILPICGCVQNTVLYKEEVRLNDTFNEELLPEDSHSSYKGCKAILQKSMKSRIDVETSRDFTWFCSTRLDTKFDSILWMILKIMFKKEAVNFMT